MKILVITYNALMTSSPNGRTMLSLLEGFDPSAISNFCVTGLPDCQYCKSGYKVTNRDAMKSLLSFREYGSEIEPKSAEKTNSVLTADVYHGKKHPWKYFLREFCWKYGRWNGRKLKKWLSEQGFDCILYMYGDGAALQDFSVFVSKYLNIPLIVYSCEEYCFKNYNYINGDNSSFFFKAYQKMSKMATERLFAAASALICNTDQLGRLFKEKYSISDVRTIMMASDMEHIENVSVPPIEEIKITYCGSLGRSRHRAILDIANALNEIDPRLKLDLYGRTDASTAELFRSHKAIRYHGFISYEEVQRVIRQSALQIQTLVLSNYEAVNRRFGFSTKNADCLSCGTPYFLYERPEIVEAQFMQEHNCAFLATDKTMLVPVLKEALFDEEKRRAMVRNAKKTADIYFNRRKNIETMNSILEKYCT